MSQRIFAEKRDTSSPQVDYSGEPDTCPLCHRGIAPRRVTAALTEEYLRNILQVVFRCPRQECDGLFIAYYRPPISEGPPRSSTYMLFDLAPINPLEESFGESVATTSPSFVEIYNQAVAAEATKLGQVAGMGYRKALEFLVKDFLIKQKPADAENIKKTMLGSCINNYVDDPRIKSVAARATWLGNDETHYVRKWIDKDIEDLKILIKLSVNWIENVLLTEKYVADMN